MKKWLAIATLGVFSFLLYLTFSAPASIAIALYEDDINLAAPDLKLGHTSGTIWQGSQEMQLRAFPAVTLNWDASAASLLFGQLDADAEINGNNLDVQFQLEAEDQSGSLNNLNGAIGSGYLNQITVPFGLDLSETVVIEGTRVAWQGPWLTELDGMLTWPGGIVHIETPQALHSVKLPGLEGRLSLNDETQPPEANLQVARQGDGTPLMHISLQSDGWGKVAISFQFLDLIDIPLPFEPDPQQDPQEPALLLEEKVF